jgi:hypothetical protein
VELIGKNEARVVHNCETFKIYEEKIIEFGINSLKGNYHKAFDIA